jgi:hypothetical protein
MHSSLSNSSLPTAETVLHNLSHLLTKGEASATARKFDPSVLIMARLAPDMLPLSRQVQISCDTVKNGLARIAGIEPPKFEDTESTFAELRERIAKTITFVKSIAHDKLDGQEAKDVTFPVGPEKTRTMKGHDYLHHWVIPNLYFHVTTAYAILRNNGVDVGKMDYLAGDKR